MGSSVSSRPPSSISRTTLRSEKSPAKVPATESKQPSTEDLNASPSKKGYQNSINEELRKKQTLKPSVSVTEPKDVMISYSHADMTTMKRVRDILESHGLTVWVDVSGLSAGVDFLSRIGQAIIDCKALISLLSEKSIKSRCCADELALAYVSQKPIYPIGLQTPQELLPLMDTGMRLQLARFDWFVLTNTDTFDENMAEFAQQLYYTLHGGSTPRPSVTSTEVQTNESKLKRTKTSMNMRSSEETRAIESSPFWATHFDGNSTCTWDKFEELFQADYTLPLKEDFGIENTEWLLQLLHRELEVDIETKIVTKDKFDEFCTVNGKIEPLWSRIQDQAIESYCMREVFDMNSSVRVEAIENLGRLRSKAVIEALMDLLDDRDNNVRTVAALSLAKTGDNSKRVITKLLQTLTSDDRLVRESGCLALGHLQAKEAVSQLVHLWRNDYISSVRDASQIALKQIGGEEANKAIHITNLLATEIRSLSE